MASSVPPSSSQTRSSPLRTKGRRSLVEREAESFAQQKSKYPRRAKALRPTWDEFRSKSFTEYVQHAFFDDSEDDDDFGNEQGKPRKIEWNHGIVKITLPEGWWDECGIGKDRTARGPSWQEGTKLGDMMVEGPIRQHLSGIGGVYEYALLDTPAMTLSEFREKADEYRAQQIRSADDGDKYNEDDHCDELAKQFWRRLGPTTPPSMYGADMEGSLFDGDPACGWSLQILDNCLQLLSADHASTEMPGVTTPYLYIGMWASVFCVHTEDMNLLSINYLHAGAPKYWYAIAPEHSKRFESLAQSRFVHAARDCPEFLRHKQNMLSPATLKKAGVPFEVQIQRPGDVIITSPGAYHFGVNLGFNVAEATNFGIPEWIPKGREAKVCMCRPNAVRIDVDRFAELLARYEEDMKNAKTLGFPTLSHRRWTLLEADRKELKAQKAPPATINESSTNEISKEKEFWVEVMQPLNAEGKSFVSSKSNRRKRRKKNNAAVCVEYDEEWRLAIPLGAKKLKLEQQVLCLLPGKKEGIHGDCSDDEECFAGVVKELADDHCRVHFSGLKKEEDVWIALTSPKLFMDGGKWEPPSKKDEPLAPTCSKVSKARAFEPKQSVAQTNRLNRKTGKPKKQGSRNVVR